MKIGFVRKVEGYVDDPWTQYDKLYKYGCDEILSDIKLNSHDDWNKNLKGVDELVVTRMYVLESNSGLVLLELIGELERKGIKLTVLNQ